MRNQVFIPPLAFAVLVTASSMTFHDASMPWLGPSFSHPLGTNEFGDDILTSALYSVTHSVANGLALTAAALLVAGIFAYLSVKGPKPFSWLLNGLTKIVESIPILLWVLATLSVISEPRSIVVTLIFMIAAFPILGTVIAGELERLNKVHYVESARLLGASEARILLHHIAPNAASVLLPLLMQVLGAAIAVDGAIGVLGLGNRSEHDLGVMMLRGRENILTHPHLAVLGLILFLGVYAYLSWAIYVLRRSTSYSSEDVSRFF